MCEELHDPFADQVACARYRAERDALAQRMEEVASEIDRTLSGVEGIEDAPAMRWMRGLREALGSLHAPRIGCEGIEAAKWVREHGGIACVKDAWNVRSNLGRQLGNEQAKVERQQRHIEFVQRKCRERRERIEELGRRVGELTSENAELRKRAMPEDCEWPRYTSGELVEVGDDVVGPDYGERIHVDAVKFHANGFTLYDKNGFDMWYESDERFERPAALAADGEPLEVGQTVWSVDSGTRYTVEKNTDELIPIKCRSEMGTTVSLHPSQLTHERPVADTWERLEEDADKNPFDYCKDVGHRLDTCENSEAYKARDIVRRARALAERGA